MSKFNVGDIVQLKSGGPKMTVDSVDVSGPGLWAAWFAGAKHERAHFNENTLELADSEKK